jgi:hypothetical protein
MKSLSLLNNASKNEKAQYFKSLADQVRDNLNPPGFDAIIQRNIFHDALKPLYEEISALKSSISEIKEVINSNQCPNLFPIQTGLNINHGKLKRSVDDEKLVVPHPPILLSAATQYDTTQKQAQSGHEFTQIRLEEDVSVQSLPNAPSAIVPTPILPENSSLLSIMDENEGKISMTKPNNNSSSTTSSHPVRKAGLKSKKESHAKISNQKMKNEDTPRLPAGKKSSSSTKSKSGKKKRTSSSKTSRSTRLRSNMLIAATEELSTHAIHQLDKVDLMENEDDRKQESTQLSEPIPSTRRPVRQVRRVTIATTPETQEYTQRRSSQLSSTIPSVSSFSSNSQADLPKLSNIRSFAPPAPPKTLQPLQRNKKGMFEKVPNAKKAISKTSSLPPLEVVPVEEREKNNVELVASLESIQGATAFPPGGAILNQKQQGSSRKRKADDFQQDQIPAKVATIPTVLMKGPAVPNIGNYHPPTTANVGKILAHGLPEILAPPAFPSAIHKSSETEQVSQNMRLDLLAKTSNSLVRQADTILDEPNAAVCTGNIVIESESHHATEEPPKEDFDEEMEANLSPSNPSVTAMSSTGMFLMRSMSSSRSKGTAGATTSIPQLLEDDKASEGDDEEMDDMASIVSAVSASIDLFEELGGLPRSQGEDALGGVEGVNSNELFDDGSNSDNFEELEDVFSQTGFQEAPIPEPDAGEKFAEMMEREYTTSSCLPSLTPPPRTDLPSSSQSLHEIEPKPLSALTPAKESTNLSLLP